MYAPIYFPPAAAPCEAVPAEGPCHVAGRYIADSGLAATSRRREAERRADAAEREARWLTAHRCARFGPPVVPGTTYEVLGEERLRARPCRVEFK